MPVNAKQITELMGLGITGQQLIAVVAIFDEAEMSTKQRAAERSRRYRKSRKEDTPSRSSRSSRDAKNQSRDGRDDKKKSDDKSMACGFMDRDAASRDERDALLLTDLSSIGSSSKEDTTEKENKEEKKVRANRKSSVTLRDDWRPSPAHFEAAARLGITVAKVYIKADDMRFWAKSTDARKADWDATFHGFLRRDVQQGANGHGKHRQGTLTDMARELADEARELERQAGLFGSSKPF